MNKKLLSSSTKITFFICLVILSLGLFFKTNIYLPIIKIILLFNISFISIKIFINLEEITYEKEETLLKIKKELKAKRKIIYLLFFLNSLALVGPYLYVNKFKEEINIYTNDVRSFFEILIHMKMVSIIIALLIGAYLISKIFIIFEIIKKEELNFLDKLMISCANEIRILALLMAPMISYMCFYLLITLVI